MAFGNLTDTGDVLERLHQVLGTPFRDDGA